jgi:streptogramin lyase
MIGTLQQYPFKLTLSASDNGVHTIDLYTQYSQSKPYPEQGKWSHLVPSWKFLDINQNVITQITTTDTPIYSGTNFIGVTGFAEYYYIDDIGSQMGEPAILWATLSVSGLPLYSESKDGNSPVPSYANSKVICPIPYYINGGTPAEIKITRNGIDSMSDSTYWVNQNIPNVFNLVYDQYPEFGCTTDAIGTLFDYPSSNALGIEMGVISSGITTIPVSSQTWVTIDDLVGPYFQKTDTKGYQRGGYSRNIVTSNTVTLNTTITAAANVLYSSYKETPYIWISNPNSALLHKIYYPYINQTMVNNITSWLDGFNINGTNNQYNTEYLETRPNVMSLSGFGGIYGIAVDPCFNIWCSDAELDKLYKFNSRGIQVSSIDLSDTSSLLNGITGGCTPAGICLDSTNKLWVTLFDSTSVLKFDGITGNLLLTINPSGNQTSPINGFGIDPDYKPTMVQTDINDNIWVTYGNTLSSYLYKYDTNGTPLTSISLPISSNPMDIIVDADNSVWITLTYHASPSGGCVNKYNSIGTPLCSIPAYHPEYLTLDNDNHLWFTSNFNKVNRLNLTTGNLTTSTIGISANPDWYNGQLNYNALEGIAADASNRIWVINSMESKVFVLSGNFTTVSQYSLSTNRIDQIVGTDFSQYDIANPYEKSLQAFGDWTGLNWQQKYGRTRQMYITGESDPFDIDSFTGYDLRKYNESWDVTTQIRDYALNDSLHEDYNLFENYIGTMIGGLETSAKSMGRALYERIANFVPNNADVDVCGINQLYSLAQSIDVPIDDYNFVIPSELKRLMDIVSIDHKILWGDHCKCAENYRGSWGYCSNCGHKHDSNRGDALDSDTYILSAGIPVLAEYKYGRDYYEKIVPNTSGNLYNYVSTYLLNDPSFYCYYEYIPTPCNIQIEGVIDWSSIYTTMSEHNSGLDVWYGDNQLIERQINYILHKGLGF